MGLGVRGLHGEIKAIANVCRRCDAVEQTSHTIERCFRIFISKCRYCVQVWRAGAGRGEKQRSEVDGAGGRVGGWLGGWMRIHRLLNPSNITTSEPFKHLAC